MKIMKAIIESIEQDVHRENIIRPHSLIVGAIRVKVIGVTDTGEMVRFAFAPNTPEARTVVQYLDQLGESLRGTEQNLMLERIEPYVHEIDGR